MRPGGFFRQGDIIMMKRASVFLFSLLMLFFWSCPEPPRSVIIGGGDLVLKPERTSVSFVNNNNFPVEIFSDSSRQNRLAYVEPKGVSASVEWSVNETGASFYPTYTIYIEDVPFPYEGEVIIARVDEGQNKIRVHLLSQLSADEKARNISNDTYIGIQNNSNYTLSLRQGTIELPVEGSTSPLLNGRESGSFRITVGPVSAYTVMRNTITPLEFPADIREMEFEPARHYSFRYSGGDKLILVSKKQLNIADALR